MAKQFEIYWFDYVNQDGTKKTRPILVLESSILLPIAEITSTEKRTDKDYEIIKWKEAGLPKKSVIRFDKIQFATNNLLQSKIGDLQQEDIDKIRELKLVESLKEELRKTNASKLFKLLNTKVNELNVILSKDVEGRKIDDEKAYNSAKEEIEKGIKVEGMWKNIKQPNSYIIKCDLNKAKELAKALCQQELITVKFKDKNNFSSKLYRITNNGYNEIENSSEVVFDADAKALPYYSIINGVAFSLGLYGNKFNLDENKKMRRDKYYVVNQDCSDWFTNLKDAISEIRRGLFGDTLTTIYEISKEYIDEYGNDMSQLGIDDEIMQFENCKLVTDNRSYRKKVENKSNKRVDYFKQENLRVKRR